MGTISLGPAPSVHQSAGEDKDEELWARMYFAANFGSALRRNLIPRVKIHKKRFPLIEHTSLR
ncbi:hypothetical protein PG984_011997 [Apiospora sp. TS-2023a]